MKNNYKVIQRILWPERASLFVIIGGAAGIASDLASFLTEIVSTSLLVLFFAMMSGFTAYLCFGRAVKVDTANEDAVKEVVNCGVCDALRFSLFAAAAFLLLLVIGQGQSATETIGKQLGLIQEDIGKISENVENIDANVQDISKVAETGKIIESPKTAQDHYTNSWLYANMYRNPQKAFESAQAIYEGDAPRKMDAAELYFNTGRQILSRDDLLTKMEGLANKNQDATLLVVAGRNATTPEESDRLYSAAQVMDPDLPFAYWDVQNMTASIGRTGISPAEQQAYLTKQINGLNKFIELIGSYPASHYFFMPQYQGDHEMMARQNLSSMERSLETYQRMGEQMKALEEKRKQLQR